MKKGLILKIFFTEETIFTEKNINENVKNISHFRNIFLHRKCLCYKLSLNLSWIYIDSETTIRIGHGEVFLKES